MAGVMIPTQQEGLMKALQMITQTMTAPDANLEQLGAIHQAVLGEIRKPVDTPVQNTPVGAAQIPLSAPPAAGAPPPPGAQMNSLSPMEQALLAAQLGVQPQAPGAPAPAAAAGSFPARGLMAGPGVPNMDEVTRMLHSAGARA
jgi:hypothetical protein